MDPLHLPEKIQQRARNLTKLELEVVRKMEPELRADYNSEVGLLLIRTKETM